MSGERRFKKIVNVLQFQTALELLLCEPFETFKNAFMQQKTALGRITATCGRR